MDLNISLIEANLFLLMVMMFLYSFASPVQASDDSLCPTIVAIYGICSPELVQNYLAHVNDSYVRPAPRPAPPTVEAKPEGTVPEIQKPVNDSPRTPSAPTPCYCAVDDSRRCITNGTIQVQGENVPACIKWRQGILGMNEQEIQMIQAYKQTLAMGLIK